MAVPRARVTETIEPRGTVVVARREGPVYQAYQILAVAFTIAPIIAGVDKFFNFLVDWTQYLTPLVPRMLGIAPATFMRGVGVVEIIAGIIVAMKPSVGGWIVGAWLCGIIINLLTIPAHFDIALRDLGLALGAFALARLGRHFDFASDV